MKVSHYKQGQPCWVELASHDWYAAKAFYQSLFQWQADDMPMPEGHYTMLQLAGDDIAAMYQMPKEMESLPTHWQLYFAVDDVEATIKAIRLAGGQIIAGPHSVGDSGIIAVCQDPDGARFSIWQAINHIGIKRSFEPNTLCWVEYMCRDLATSTDFYTQALGFETNSLDMSSMGIADYVQWLVDKQAIGGMMQMTSEWGDTPPHWMLYFSVQDCDAMAQDAEALGGRICVPPTDIPDVGRFAVIDDPQGGTFSIIALTEVASEVE
ncbi:MULTISPECIES: VOC family protein [unclassified Shewanella]|uniref:VOC family protein n=1 Tax=unclassified Shewanella TaxID=196818 RepID=UPI000C8635F7|nr:MULTISPECIES: VOC family protein [unclassified Shewanella]MDO6641986.1 VOC family protein [Shewanella sp. 5_MG-2023]MDO6678109.1 VOC family protein [Shewanella sp. 4_MG-2023]MDO6774463.1 VOC family protein [Shewanella sp. 3_MG-2023]PMG26000.1 glyoxalase [Shewanella sp. 10N.286.52.C2]PMG41122.1 glyoxalase [Shewanella sp. 10N.286.52.B9]